MKSLKDLKLTKKTEKKVEAWLKEWLNLFIDKADGRTGNVFKADWEKDEFFYFTECNDILKDDPESKSVESNEDIKRRKTMVKQQLLIRQLLGEKLGKKVKCSHCGYEDTEMYSCVNGHYNWCPHCKKIKLTGYLDTIVYSALQAWKELILQEFFKE